MWRKIKQKIHIDEEVILSRAKSSVNLLEKVCSCTRKRGCAIKREGTEFMTFTVLQMIIFALFIHVEFFSNWPS